MTAAPPPPGPSTVFGGRPLGLTGRAPAEVGTFSVPVLRAMPLMSGGAFCWSCQRASHRE